MEMVADQHPGMHPPAMASACLAQAGYKYRVVFLGLEDPLPPVTTGHHMIYRSGVLEAQGPSHTPRNPTGPESQSNSALLRGLTRMAL